MTNAILSLKRSNLNILIYDRDDTNLASVGSKDTEFDVKELKAQAKSTPKIGKYMVKYKLSNSNEIIVAKG